ncbi:MAG: hypothetical protein ACI9FG_000604 [Crocinitomicaceae bacterium]|jgi:uncharacterized protein YegJ (DUF2314 family)
MFNIFRKKTQREGPHPLKVHFAKTYIPTTIQEVRSGFINAMASDDAVGVLSRSWIKFGQANIAKKEMIDSTGLDVTVLREEDHLLVVITLPTPTCEGEPHFSAAVFGPPEGGEWTKEAIDSAPSRYFVALASGEGSTIEELVGEKFLNLGSGPEVDLHLFIEWVLNQAVRDLSIVSVRSGDEEMETAIAHARERLPKVLDQFLADELDEFTVKIRVSDGNDHEHFWLSDTKYVGGKFIGSIEAPAQTVSNITEGQEYEAELDEVTDWMHLKNGMMHGNHTLRVLLPKMPKDEAAQYASRLAPLD